MKLATDALEERQSRTRHDFRQYIHTASFYPLEQEHYEELKEYFHQFPFRRAPKNADAVCYCKNMSVDPQMPTLLCVTAGAKGIKVQIFSGEFPEG